MKWLKSTKKQRMAMKNPAVKQAWKEVDKALDEADKAIEEFKPDVYIGIEDIWAFGGYSNKPWWNQINTMVWPTLDSLPILPQAVDFAPKVKNYYVWSSFAEKALNNMGYPHVKTLRGSLDTSNFF